jgi:hypothetical protein
MQHSLAVKLAASLGNQPPLLEGDSQISILPTQEGQDSLQTGT